jgi:hypothetical protein
MFSSRALSCSAPFLWLKVSFLLPPHSSAKRGAIIVIIYAQHFFIHVFNQMAVLVRRFIKLITLLSRKGVGGWGEKVLSGVKQPRLIFAE